MLQELLTQTTSPGKSPGRGRRQSGSLLRRARRVTAANCLRPLTATAQQYAWGRIGSSSTVARMKEAAAAADGGGDGGEPDFSIDEGAPYAELWLGTHPSGMSTVRVPVEHAACHHITSGDGNDLPRTNPEHSRSITDEALSDCTDSAASLPPRTVRLLDYVRSDPALHLGHRDDDDLRFLLKVLSVRKVLSIQAHPDKRLAEQLHAAHPEVYRDPNHKPEMAIALSEHVRALFGFRPLAEVARHLEEYPEFRRLIGPTAAAQVQRAAAEWTQHQQESSSLSHGAGRSPLRRFSNARLDEEVERLNDLAKSALRNLFHDYITADEASVAQAVDDMLHRLRTDPDTGDSISGRSTPTLLENVPKLMFQLHEQFPGDCGIFAPLLFNIVHLHKGEALFIAANEPHAYISGEIVECMACSDNVVRAGLTPKAKDVPTLLNMLTYRSCRPVTTGGEAVDACTTRYLPPVPDFCVDSIVVPPGETYEVRAVDSPSVLLVVEGDGALRQDPVLAMPVAFGQAFFCSAGTAVTVVAGEYGIALTRASNNVFL